MYNLDLIIGNKYDYVEDYSNKLRYPCTLIKIKTDEYYTYYIFVHEKSNIYGSTVFKHKLKLRLKDERSLKLENLYKNNNKQ